MTSKHLFFKAMREDMRNRGWMIALSVLGSFLTLPVVWLMGINNVVVSSYNSNFDRAGFSIFANEELWRSAINYLAGIMIIGGALVAALAGFRFIFHKDQVDTWHSLPIKRNMLFWVCYLNGCIVWLAPLLIATVLTAVLSGSMVLRQWGGGMEDFYEVVRFAAGNFAVWTVVFLLVYNLVLLAMMFSGNVLNTMVSMLIMGFGGATLYALGIQLCECYFDSFLFFGSSKALTSMYVSPFVSAVVLLLQRGEEIEGYYVGSNLLIAAALAVCAWLLYRKRPSELAEQGIRSRVFSTVLRLVTALGAGVGGWLFFGAVTSEDIMWSVFGVLLAAVLVHGILDVVFRMDFRAFFAHKLQMAGTVAAALFVCFAFYGDWFGYDSYLPAKEQIAEIGVRVESLSNRSDFNRSSLEMSYQDIETAYAFLQKMTGKINYKSTKFESVEVRVTLKNGRTYYRRYHMGDAERELLMPIVSSGEYLKCAYCLNESVAENHKMTLQPVRGRQYFAERKFAEGELLELLRAYNQDVLENPETVLLGEDRILTEINLSFVRTDGYGVTANLDIYESMRRTIEALKSLGYEELVTPLKAAQITSVGLSVDNFGVYRTAEDIVKAAREKYQVYGGEEYQAYGGENGPIGEQAASLATPVDYVNQEYSSTRQKDLTLYITDQEEIEELLPLISYSDGTRRRGVFKKSVISISITDREGETIECYIRAGDLPEKYVLRFGELIEDKEK